MMSRRPNSRTAIATRARTSTSRVTSIWTIAACPPPARICAAVASRSDTRRAPSTTAAPSRARCFAHASPMPEEAPVIATTRPDKDMTRRYYGPMDPAIRLLRDLVAIDSVNPSLVPGAAGEAAIAGAIAAHLRGIGLDVEVQD